MHYQGNTSSLDLALCEVPSAVQQTPSFDPLWPFGSSTPVIVETDGSDNQISTQDTIAVMALAVLSGSGAGYPYIVQLAQLLRAEALSLRDAVDAAFYWVKQHVQVVPDEEMLNRHFGGSKGRDLVIPPDRLLNMPEPKGDCGTFSTLLASILVAMRVPVSFVTIKADVREPSNYSHVYVLAHLAEGDVPLDSSHGSVPGWESQQHFGRKEWPILD